MADLISPPNRIPWPPIIYGGMALAAFVLGRIFPDALRLPGGAALAVLGVIVLLAGAALDVWAMRTMRRQNANIHPNRAATALVTSGPFAWSRNPLYLGNTLVLAGIGLAFGDGWFLLAAAAGALLVTPLAIRREEAHLAALFGPAWEAYARRTGRWFTLRPKSP